MVAGKHWGSRVAQFISAAEVDVTGYAYDADGGARWDMGRVGSVDRAATCPWSAVSVALVGGAYASLKQWRSC